MPGILALDLGTTTGWATAAPEAIAEWPEPIPGTRGPIEGVGYGWHRFRSGNVVVEFDGWLANFLQGMRPEHVIVEAPIPHHKSMKANELARGMNAAAEIVCARYGLTLLEEHNARVKKHFTGRGRAAKEEIIARCQQRGWAPERHDTADALALLDMAVCMLHVRNRGRAA